MYKIGRPVHGVEDPDKAGGVQPGVVLLLAHEPGLRQYFGQTPAQEFLYAGIDLGHIVGLVFVMYVSGELAVIEQQPGFAHGQLSLGEQGGDIHFQCHNAPPQLKFAPAVKGRK